MHYLTFLSLVVTVFKLKEKKSLFYVILCQTCLQKEGERLTLEDGNEHFWEFVGQQDLRQLSEVSLNHVCNVTCAEGGVDNVLPALV